MFSDETRSHSFRLNIIHGVALHVPEQSIVLDRFYTEVQVLCKLGTFFATSYRVHEYLLQRLEMVRRKDRFFFSSQQALC